MFQFIRNATPRNGASIPVALRFAAEVTGYLNKTYGTHLRFGIRIFGKPQLFWEMETESVDKLTALNAKLMQDREYAKMLENADDLFVDGSLEDTIVSFVD
jgi:hypothetical protein